MDSKIIKIIIFLLSVILALAIILSTLSCSKINLETFGLSSDEEAGAKDSQYIDDNREDSGESAGISPPGNSDSDNKDIDTNHIGIDSSDTTRLRLYYKEAVKFFDEQSYLIAEYYFNKIKYSYLLLQDHIFYYLAKSLLLQEKYDQSEEHYLKLIENYPDSVWTEIASLE